MSLSVAALYAGALMPEEWKQPIQEVMAWVGVLMAVGGLIAAIINNAQRQPLKTVIWVVRLPIRVLHYILRQLFGPIERAAVEKARAWAHDVVAGVITEEVPIIVHEIVEEHLQPVIERTEQLLNNGGSSIKDKIDEMTKRLEKFEAQYMKDTK